MITDSQTNKVYFSELLQKRAPKTFSELLSVLRRYDVTYDSLSGTNDIWCRDYMPVQISGDKYAGYTYNPDYLQNLEEDRKTITDGTVVARGLGLKVSETQDSIIIDGGNVIKCDGKVIMTEKVVVENQAAYSRPALKTALEDHFDAEVIFLPWDKCEYFGHADGLVRYVGNNRALVTYYRQYSNSFVDRVIKILKDHFAEVYELKFPLIREHKYSWAYINWLQTSQVLILPKFGYVEDAMALQQIKKLMPEYEGRIEQIDVRDLIKDGGCLNCATWNVYSVTREKEVIGLMTYRDSLIQDIMDSYEELSKFATQFQEYVEFTPRYTREEIYKQAAHVYSIMDLRNMLAEMEQNYRTNAEEIIRIMSKYEDSKR